MDKNSTNFIKGKFKGKDILSIEQFSPKDLQILFSHTARVKEIVQNSKQSNVLRGKIITLLFFEPSSRTFGSFASAVKRLGGNTIEVQDVESVSSVAKGESLEDTIKTFEAYSDAIIIRHKTAGSAKKSADAAIVPIINAGDGGNSHPTQTLYDLYAIYEKFKRLDNLTVLATGDIVHSRTIKSLIYGLSLFKGNTAYLLSPRKLRLAKADFLYLSQKGLNIQEIHDEKSIPKNAHVWYWNRIQKERFANKKETEKYKDSFILTTKLLKNYGNKQMIVMDPLPRVGEIDIEVDEDPRAVYFKNQIRNGLYVRMALLGLVLGK